MGVKEGRLGLKRDGVALDDRQVDALVDAITVRVKEELGLGGRTGVAPSGQPHGTAELRPDGRRAHAPACLTCEMPGSGCASCGLNLAVAAPAFQPVDHKPTGSEMARYIDHTLLHPQTARADLERVCREARQHTFFSVCVNAGNARLVSALLSGSPVKTCAVVGFPLGAGTPASKAFEAREAVRCGADEIDMVLNIGALKSRDFALVTEDIAKVVKAVPGKLVKVILETGMLTDQEKVIACALSKVAAAHFVKTSTGFGPGGATADDVALMRGVVGREMGVKASGGVRSLEDAHNMLASGANRIGASSSVAIVTGQQGTSGY